MELTVGSIEIACGSHGGRLEVVVAVGLYLSPQEGREDPVEGEEGGKEKQKFRSRSLSPGSWQCCGFAGNFTAIVTSLRRSRTTWLSRAPV